MLDDSPEVAAATSRHLVFALQKAVARKVSPVDTVEASGKVICVLGPKGGIGKTITSCNLAIALTMRNKRVALVDLDLQFGDVALSLGLTPDTTIYDLAVSGGELDAEKLDAFLMRHPSGLRVLAAPRATGSGAVRHARSSSPMSTRSCAAPTSTSSSTRRRRSRPR